MYIIHVNVPPSPTDDTGGSYYWALWESISNALGASGLDVQAWKPSGGLQFETNAPKRALDIILGVLQEAKVEGERPGSSIYVLAGDVSRLIDGKWHAGEYRLGDGKWQWHRWGGQP